MNGPVSSSRKIRANHLRGVFVPSFVEVGDAALRVCSRFRFRKMRNPVDASVDTRPSLGVHSMHSFPTINGRFRDGDFEFRWVGWRPVNIQTVILSRWKWRM